MTDIERAKELLKKPSATCALCRGDDVYISERPGIAPMLGYLYDKTELRGFSAADKIIGKAAALLFARAGVREVYGEALSRTALPVLERYGIKASWGELPDVIVNRSGDGLCPMELTVADIDDPAAAEAALRAKLAELTGKKTP